ncbi:hypothetical protein Y032_0155g3088 [Ancylostoma ceylanicum]|uniref:Uncharacterized protein n=1 Tax=Ancylostoma ceylanicum TaxID=53326 RepID=A0A016T001_9BILA|nr:hypothetical protein Y032_0155g3088 [Ancylostoma ceylanicum]
MEKLPLQFLGLSEITAPVFTIIFDPEFLSLKLKFFGNRMWWNVLLLLNYRNYSPYAQSVESFRARRACDACAARPACNSGPASALRCSRTPFLRLGSGKRFDVILLIV